MKKINFSLVASLILLALVVWLKAFEPSFIVQFQNQTFDLYQRIKPREYEPVPVRIVDIDDASLSRLGQWPWPRTMVASLVDKLRADGAAVVAFDIVFAEPDRTSPKQMLTLWGKQSLEPALANLPDHDALLGQAIAQAPVITSFVLTQNKTGLPATKSGVSFAGENPLVFVPEFAGAVDTLPILSKGAKGTGALNNQPDSDGISRHIPLVMRIGDHLYPSLLLEALRVAQGAGGILIKSVGANGEDGTAHGITAVKTGDIVLPTDTHGRQWVYYTGSVEDRYLPAWKVLNGEADQQKINGHIVLIGTSAAGLKDIRASPNNPAMPGVEILAQGLEQALLGTSLSRPDWIRGAEITLMVVAGLLLLSVNYFLSPLWGLGFMLLILTATAAISWMSFATHHVLVEPVLPVVTIVLLYLSDSLARYLRAERERVRIRNTFAQYMSPELVRQLAAHPEQMTLGGENKMISIMFCDMQGFTALSEQLSPMELTKLISRFLTPMTEQVLANKGTVDKYIGDCVMAFWNAPLPDQDHARNAAKAALGMRSALQSLNADDQSSTKFRASIAINTSECCVGNMGTEQRFNYSAVGDGVNLTSRLEAQCKFYGVDIIIAEETAKAVQDFALLELDLIRVKGKKTAVRIYVLMGNEMLASTPAYRSLQQHHQALLEAYRACDWDRAQRAQKECAHLAQDVLPSLESLYMLYGKRIAEFRANPPPKGWDGVLEKQSK